MQAPAWKSLLFVAANDEARCAKACAIAADAVILDLEDGVGAEAKDAARARIAPASAALVAAGRSVVVRINSEQREAAKDLDASIRPGVTAIMAPKVIGAHQIQTLDEMIGEIEAERGLPAGAAAIIALIESPLALTRLHDIAAAPRIIGLALGPEDFCLELGVAPTPAALDLPSRLVALAAAGRGLMAMATPISIAAFRDLDAYAAATRAGAAFGANAAICVHPDQVKIANEVFQPSAAECDEATKILSAWRAANSAGQDIIALDGRMIDRPVAERARRLLARAGRV